MHSERLPVQLPQMSRVKKTRLKPEQCLHGGIAPHTSEGVSDGRLLRRLQRIQKGSLAA